MCPTCNSSQGIAPHSSQETAATCKRTEDLGPSCCRITSTVVSLKYVNYSYYMYNNYIICNSNLNVAIDTRSRRRQVLPSDGSEGDDMFVL